MCTIVYRQRLTHISCARFSSESSTLFSFFPLMSLFLIFWVYECVMNVKRINYATEKRQMHGKTLCCCRHRRCHCYSTIFVKKTPFWFMLILRFNHTIVDRFGFCQLLFPSLTCFSTHEWIYGIMQKWKDLFKLNVANIWFKMNQTNDWLTENEKKETNPKHFCIPFFFSNSKAYFSTEFIVPTTWFIQWRCELKWISFVYLYVYV